MQALRRAVLSSSAIAVAAAASPAAAPYYPPFGIDLGARDERVAPGANFFQFANGRYLSRVSIPEDQSSITRRSDMSDRITERLRTILSEAASRAPANPVDETGKVGAFYASYMDDAAIERQGIRPILPELEAIRTASYRADLTELMGRSNSEFYPSPYQFSLDVDLKNPRSYAGYLGQSGVGLPDVDYYTLPDFAGIRLAYQSYAQQLLSIAGWPKAAAKAAAILALETRIARVSWTNVERRDPAKQYHPVALRELQTLAPQFAWDRYMAGVGRPDALKLVLTQDTAIPRIAAVIAETPLEDLKAWMVFRVLDDAAPILDRRFTDARFSFRNHLLAGEASPAPRWKRGIEVVGGANCSLAPHSCFGTLKWAVGRLYANRYFPPETKVKITQLAIDVKAAFRQRLEQNDWLSPAAKAEALRKLDAYVIKVGYPDHWQDYRDVRIRKDDLVGNVRAGAAADWTFFLRRSLGPVDRTEWLLTPQENNAYQGSFSDIVFPAGILQAPIFDAAADPAVNFGAIGAVIGHELTHGFDDEGRSVDSAGALRDWWTPHDAAAFKTRTAVLGDQYSRYQPLPGLRINPGLTMGENIADLGGVSIALDAYHLSLHGHPAARLAGLTADQRFFLGWAQAWAGKATPAEIRRLTTSDPHSYRIFRVNGVVRNIDGWYDYFHIKPSDPLYLPPAQRARIW